MTPEQILLDSSIGIAFLYTLYARTQWFPRFIGFLKSQMYWIQYVLICIFLLGVYFFAIWHQAN